MCVPAESPAIIAEQERVAAKMNQTVNLSVYTSTYLGPQPEDQLRITWHLTSGETLNSTAMEVEAHQTGSTLVVSRVTAHSVGEYTCSVQQVEDGVLHFRSVSINLTLFGEQITLLCISRSIIIIIHIFSESTLIFMLQFQLL